MTVELPPLRQALVVGVVVFAGVYLLQSFVDTGGVGSRLGLAAFVTAGVLAWLSNRRVPRD